MTSAQPEQGGTEVRVRGDEDALLAAGELEDGAVLGSLQPHLAHVDDVLPGGSEPFRDER